MMQPNPSHTSLCFVRFICESLTGVTVGNEVDNHAADARCSAEMMEVTDKLT